MLPELLQLPELLLLIHVLKLLNQQWWVKLILVLHFHIGWVIKSGVFIKYKITMNGGKYHISLKRQDLFLKIV